MNKYSGQTKKKQEKRSAKKKDGVSSLISSIAGQTQKFINEWSEKHNSLANHVTATFNTIMGEVQKVWQNQAAFAGSLEHVDGNVLAFAQMLKDVYSRFAIIDAMLKKLEELTESKLIEGMEEELKTAGETLYAEQVKAAFDLVNEQRKREAEAREAALEKADAEDKAARDAQKAAEAVKAETEVAQRALSEAENEKFEDVSKTGGKGQDIPEGAQVFGG